jgi:arginase family enzyme
MGERWFLGIAAIDLVRLLLVQGRRAELAELGDFTREVEGLFDPEFQMKLWAFRARELALDGEIAEAIALADQGVAVAQTTDQLTFHAEVLRDRPALVRFADHQVRANPAGCAKAALTALQRHTSSQVVHFDVDAVDSRDLPLANFPHYGTGIPLDAAGEVLTVLCGTPTLAAIVLTEVNPSYDPSGQQLTRYIDTVTSAIERGFAAH